MYAFLFSEYYFSRENLQKDFFLRRKMDSEGFLPVTLVASFNRVRSLTNDVSFIMQVKILKMFSGGGQGSEGFAYVVKGGKLVENLYLPIRGVIKSKNPSYVVYGWSIILFLLQAVAQSEIVEVKDGKLRSKDDPTSWPLTFDQPDPVISPKPESEVDNAGDNATKPLKKSKPTTTSLNPNVPEFIPMASKVIYRPIKYVLGTLQV